MFRRARLVDTPIADLPLGHVHMVGGHHGPGASGRGLPGTGQAFFTPGNASKAIVTTSRDGTEK